MAQTNNSTGLIMSYAVFSELAADCSDVEQEFSLAHINEAIAHLQNTIQVLEKQKDSIGWGEVPDFLVCDRLQRLSKRARNLLNMAEGKEATLPRF